VEDLEKKVKQLDKRVAATEEVSQYELPEDPS
jgi:hypothetical protein